MSADVLRKLLDLFTPAERKQASRLLVMTVLVAIFEVIGVASILPFISILANPQILETNAILNSVRSWVGIESSKDFNLLFGLLVFVTLVLSLSFKAITTYLQLRFILISEHNIGRRLVEGYLRQPYAWFLNRHSADLGKTVLSEVSMVASGAIMPMMTLISQALVAFAILVLLVAVDVELALIVSLVLGCAYGLMYMAVSSYLVKIGREHKDANKQRFAAISEVFAAVKEVKLYGLEESYVSRFSRAAKVFAKHHASATVIAQVPRYFLEALAFGGLLLVILYLMASKGDFSEALPIISLYAFAGYRLMPALQQAYASFSQLRFVGPELDGVHAELIGLSGETNVVINSTPLKLGDSIELRDIYFSYPNTSRYTLENLNLSIPIRSTVALVGATGCGKTTAIDLILGLLKPQKGVLAADGLQITDADMRRWQRVIGYVPQQIYLSDNSIEANIAFGVNTAEIDRTAVEVAAKIANIHNFIVDQLPDGYKTTVGERGARLSGGQRQRIGIARALYHSPQVLIMDEATSALDNITEQAVMEAIHNLSHKITIILIAHRLSTVRECDLICLMENGKVVAQGDFDHLLNECKEFQVLAQATT